MWDSLLKPYYTRSTCQWLHYVYGRKVSAKNLGGRYEWNYLHRYWYVTGSALVYSTEPQEGI